MATRWSSRSIVERVSTMFWEEFHKIRRLDCGGGASELRGPLVLCLRGGGCVAYKGLATSGALSPLLFCADPR